MIAVSLFISNFKGVRLAMKKSIKYMIACLAFCAMLAGCGKIFRYILVDDTAAYTRITFHEMYEKENIDVLFAGSSHCYRSFVPGIFDEEWGVTAFNAGTSSQKLDGSYMVIREAARYNDVQHVYLELYYEVAYDTYKARTDMTQVYIISDYLKPSLDKIRYILNASAKEYYPNSFIPARRYWTSFFDADYVKNLIAKKSTEAYKKYEYEYVTLDSEGYVGDGYVANMEAVADWNYFAAKGWDSINIDDFSEDWVHSLEDIIAFCDKRGISLTLISAPMPNYLLAGRNYDEYVELVQNLIEGKNISYYDFNLCKEQFFPSTSSLFADADHLNCHGAETVSYLLARLIKGEIAAEELFYDSYDEKLEALEPTVFGVSYHDSINSNGEQIRECKVVSTENENLEYEITILPTEGEVYKVQDFSDNRLFSIPQEEHGIITVLYRLSDSPDKLRTINVTY